MPTGRHRRERRDKRVGGVPRSVRKVTGMCAACLADPPAHHWGRKVRRCRCGCASQGPRP